MADKVLTVLGVHGLGDHRASDWQVKWPEAIKAAFPEMEGLSSTLGSSPTTTSSTTRTSPCPKPLRPWEADQERGFRHRTPRTRRDRRTSPTRSNGRQAMWWPGSRTRASSARAASASRRRAHARARRHSRPQPRLAGDLQRLFPCRRERSRSQRDSGEGELRHASARRSAIRS